MIGERSAFPDRIANASVSSAWGRRWRFLFQGGRRMEHLPPAQAGQDRMADGPDRGWSG